MPAIVKPERRYTAGPDRDQLLNRLESRERPESAVPVGRTTLTVRTAAPNHHDAWTLD